MDNISLLYRTINKAITYMKSKCDNIITKELFIQIKDAYPQMYGLACQFYNTSNISKMLKYTVTALNQTSKDKLDTDVQSKEVLANQYESLFKTIKDAKANLNMDTILKIIDNVSDVEAQKINIRLIVKGLVVLQVLYSIQDVIDTTIENNGTYTHLTEYKSANLNDSIEHIFDISMVPMSINEILAAEDDLSNQNLQDKIYKLFSEASEEDVIEFTEGDLFEDDYDDDDSDETSYSSDRIDEYIERLYLKAMFMVKNSLDKLMDSNYTMLPDTNFLMYLVVVLLMHYMLKW